MAGDFDLGGKTNLVEKINSNGDELKVEGDRILVNQVYCRNGHPLIFDENPKFEGKPGIKVLAVSGDDTQEIHLSPYQRDPRKKFDYEYDKHTLLTLKCPECEDVFPRVAPHDCCDGSMYISIFLKPDGNVQKSICICNAWGCYASFAKLFNEVITDLRQYVPKPLF